MQLKRSVIFFKITIKIFIFLCFPYQGFASSPGSHHITKIEPWFTGPLLTPGANVVPKGHYNIQPFLFFTNTYGQYNAHWNNTPEPHLFTASLVLDIEFGLSRICDFQFNPLILYKKKQHIDAWTFGDMPISLGFQLVQGTPNRPAIKLKLLANLPIGKYQNLDLNKKGLDAGGLGSYLPGIGLIIARTFHISCSHFLATRLNLSYRFPNSVSVKGVNVYGGIPQTRGKIFPGNIFTSSLGLEWSFTRHWALACDIQYTHFNKTRFTGTKGFLHKSSHLMGEPSKEQLSIAPAIEYNFNKDLGIIAGCWFTVAGRNTPAFASGVLSLNIYK